ncbi:hypothetical protein [Methylocystis parvus]|uniref:Uncharacterized protein n=1 Tax=Methylocystis parvus TaxID=134 RepID=A0A6B8M5I5_9HYPH|nr:hypothetical protein [Methylocystis parvus]QGM96593.1 hypothetical protein F7D14_03230 [Methylocystis parvus]WBJ99552.1 hypothetical protein MMG94_16400 [Methylocystis parvus OBBP]
MTSDVQLIEPSESRQKAVEELQSKTLVNPVSGLANDYLNLFNELVMMLEQIPQMPELLEDLCAWRPVSYQEYFRKSALPGRHSALAAYEQLSPSFRRRFETFVAELDVIALASVASVRRQFRDGAPQDMERVAATCARAGEKMRIILIRASRLVNYSNIDG